MHTILDEKQRHLISRMDNNVVQSHGIKGIAIVLLSVLASVGVTLLVLFLILTHAPQYVAPLIPQKVPAATTTESVISSSIPDIVEQVEPAVVSVVITADVPIIERYFDEFDPFGGFFGWNFGFNVPRERQLGTERREIGAGTGFFVSPDGFLITNRHVVDTEGAVFSIVMKDGNTYDVTVVAKDPTLDIAVLKVDADETFPYVEFGDSDTLRLGETVIAIGNALAEFPNSVSVGVVSGLARNIVASDMFGSAESLEGVIQTDAAINQGNSGGPLLNGHGKVIGMNVAVAGNSENIGFALPGNSVRNVYESVREHGEIIRPFVGVRYIRIDETIAEANDLDVDYGILIIRGQRPEELAVIPGSAADKAGLEENDIILEIDGTKLDQFRSFAGLIREYGVGDTIELKVLHDGEEKAVRLTLEQAPID